jgi:hypothetical protein
MAAPQAGQPRDLDELIRVNICSTRPNDCRFRAFRQAVTGTEHMPDQDDHSMFRHGARQLAGIAVGTYNVELRHSDGYIGDRASKGAFEALLEDWRQRLRQVGEDPLGEKSTSELKKKKLDQLLLKGDPEGAGLVHTVVEEFAQELASVTRRFLRLREWRDMQTIVVGGGLRASRIGGLAIGRAALLLKGDGAHSQPSG